LRLIDIGEVFTGILAERFGVPAEYLAVAPVDEIEVPRHPQRRFAVGV
jgi:putative NADH-flavin reductase